MEKGQGSTTPRFSWAGAARFGGLIDVAVIAIAVGLGAAAAWWAFPAWDDGVLWLGSLEGGVEAIARNQPDRPLVSALWTALARRGLLWEGAAAAYVATWFLTGIVTLTLWRRFFPEWRAYGAVAALLAVAPVALETQTVAVNPIFTAHAQLVLVYLSQLWLWRPSARRTLPRIGVAGAVTFAMCSMTEYAVLATLLSAGVSWLLLRLQSLPADQRRANIRALVAMVAVAVVGYAVYHSLGNADARPDIRPERQLAALGWTHLLEIPLRVPFSLYTGVMGEFLKDLGEVNFSRATVWGLPCGALVAAAVVLRARGTKTANDERDGNAMAPGWQRALVLLVPLVLGVCAVVAMGTSIRGNYASRGWLSMVPLLGCLTLFVLLTVVRRRFHLLVVGLAAFVPAYLEANAVRGARLAATELARLGQTLHAELAPTGLTVALFANFPTNHAVNDPIPRPYELISHLTRGWPSADRDRFWAGAFPWQPIHDSVGGLGGACGPVEQVQSESGRGWSRRGAIAKTLWVSFDADGRSYIEGGSTRH